MNKLILKDNTNQQKSKSFLLNVLLIKINKFYNETVLLHIHFSVNQ